VEIPLGHEDASAGEGPTWDKSNFVDDVFIGDSSEVLIDPQAR